jgi:hypothetical protein
MTDGIVQVAVDSTGKKIDTSEITVGANTVERQRVVIGDPTLATQLLDITAAGAARVDLAPNALGRMRANTFRTPGRAGTAGQKIFALHNATGSTVHAHIEQITVDLVQTVIKAVTVLPPVIRCHRFTAVPTNGTALAKVLKDTTLATSASLTAWGDASADGTSSASALTVTIPSGNMLTQEFAPRLITAAGYEMFDRSVFLDGGVDVVLGALEGVVVFLDYVLATQNPITDMWISGCDWYEI